MNGWAIFVGGFPCRGRGGEISLPGVQMFLCGWFLRNGGWVRLKEDLTGKYRARPPPGNGPLVPGMASPERPDQMWGALVAMGPIPVCKMASL